MPEPEDACPSVGRFYELHVACPPEGLQHVRLGHARDARQQSPVELPAQDGGRHQDVRHALAERGEPVAHGPDDRCRHAGGHVAVNLPAGIGPHKLARRDRRSENLLDRERQPVAIGEQPSYPGGNVRYVQACSGHLADSGRRQAGYLDACRNAPGEGRLQQLGGCRRLTVPQRYHAERPRGRDVVGQVLSEREGVRVGPVQVLEHEQAAWPLGQGEHPQHRLAEYDGRDLRAAVAGLAPFGHQRANGGAVVGESACVRNDACPGGAHEGLGHRPVRDGNGRLSRAPGQYLKSARKGVCRYVFREPGLSDPSVASNKHRAAVTVGSRVRGRGQCAKLSTAADEYRAQHRLHSRDNTRAD